MNISIFILPLSILVAFLLPVGVNGGIVNYSDCGSKANVTEFSVSGCSTQPCIFTKGKTYDVKIKAIGTCESLSLPYKVTAKISFIPITLQKGNACHELSEGACPVEIGKEFTYEDKIMVLSKFPSVKTTVKALVADDRGNTVICAKLAIKIKS